MLRLRLAILGDSPCDLCTAACCRQNGHDYAVLLEGEVERRRFAPWARDVRMDAGGHGVLERVLPYREGRCVFLGDDNRCTIYEDRPLNCRRFECIDGFHAGGRPGEHSRFLRLNPHVLNILNRL